MHLFCARRRHLLLAAMTPALGLFAAAARSAGFADPLDTPAPKTERPAAAAYNALARAGQRLVAVGQRGHVVLSDDQGLSWTQADVPVGSDLAAVRFASATRGWAAGHDGVVLTTQDGGRSWARQLDGRQVGQLMRRQHADGPAALAAEAARYADQGADKPFLDVWFEDADTGWAVGAFNLIVRTEDAGRTWQSWFDRTDNPKALNLYGIGSAHGTLYAVGEQGLVLRLDRASRRWVALPVPYKGGFFGVIGSGSGSRGAVLAYGLRGNVYRSIDAGAQWHKVVLDTPFSITAAADEGEGRLLLVNQAGQLFRSVDEGASFVALPAPQPFPAAALLPLSPGRVVLAGMSGLRLVDVPVAARKAIP